MVVAFLSLFLNDYYHKHIATEQILQKGEKTHFVSVHFSSSPCANTVAVLRVPAISYPAFPFNILV